MALSKSSMRGRIITKIEALNANLNGANKAILEPFIEAMCDGIIEEIKANLEVKVQVTGVTPGAGTANGQQTEVK